MSRERVLKAIRFEGLDRPPLRHQDILPSTFQRHGQALYDLFDKYPPDILSLTPAMPASYNPPYVEQPDTGRRWMDEWGCLWASLDDTMGQVLRSALANWDNLAKYQLPSADDPHMFAGPLKTRLQSQDKFCTGKVAFGIWDRIMFLRGGQSALIDLASEVDKVKQLADRILEYNLALIQQWAVVPEPPYRVDGIYITDDYGLEKGLIMSPNTWRDIFKPRYAEMVQTAHEASVIVQFHSCGDIRSILPDLVEIGIDILGPLQAPPLSIEDIGREFRGEVTFLGFIDSKELLHNGSPQQVAECVLECIETLGTSKGGYIVAPSTTIMPQVPFENIKTLIQTAAEYRYDHDSAQRLVQVESSR